ncbi:MAG: PhzF family phenazine biosynthesis protein [Spirochaetia bacterium]|nr:PhzF family phenazine biosynthesis protein [Spirochaetia bacterium]
MKIKVHHVDAFADHVFRGNPAAVCPLDAWLPETQMQNIAQENNLPETAFVVRTEQSYHIRWFTPIREVDLCGHATLASAFVLWQGGVAGDEITFESASGPLRVFKRGDQIFLDFPSRPPQAAQGPHLLEEALGSPPSFMMKSRDFLLVYDTEDEIYAMTPDFATLRKVDAWGIIVSAPSRRYDFVSRFFAPAAGIDEDPVTGSAYCTLIPYWSERLGRKTLRAYQASKRGGEVTCEDAGGRVLIGGRCVPYMTGEISIPD